MTDRTKTRAALDWLSGNAHNPEDWDTMNYISELVEKATPKKPDKATTTTYGIDVTDGTEDWVVRQEEYYECPVCGGFLGYVSDCEDERYQCNYCSSCGQAIDREVQE